jgi:hypothetical protein
MSRANLRVELGCSARAANSGDGPDQFKGTREEFWWRHSGDLRRVTMAT